MSRNISLIGCTLLISLSIPLILLAVLTSCIAFTTLFLRVSIVYFELGLALFRSWLLPPPPPKPLPTPKTTRVMTPILTSSTSSRREPRKRRSPSNPDVSAREHRPASRSESFTSLVGAGEPNRDFEGVGGWRLTRNVHDEALWIGMNSRLELPAAGGERQRRHRRSLSSQSQRFARSPEAFRMSPVASRNRTPPGGEGTMSPEGYFSIPTAEMKMSRHEYPSRMGYEERKRSISGSSATSSLGGV